MERGVAPLDDENKGKKTIPFSRHNQATDEYIHHILQPSYVKEPGNIQKDLGKLLQVFQSDDENKNETDFVKPKKKDSENIKLNSNFNVKQQKFSYVFFQR